MNLRALKIRIFTVALAALLSACSVRSAETGGAGTGGNAQAALCGVEDASVTQQRAANFDKGLHALLLQNTCVGCHDGNSGLAPFPHSSTDLNKAYQAAVQLVDLKSPATSKIVLKVQADHNCGSDTQCQSLAREMIAKIQTWSDDEAKLPAAPKCDGSLASGLSVSLTGKRIKNATLSKTAATVLRWDISAANATVGKMTFSVDVYKFTDPSTNGLGTYKLQNLVLASENYRVKVLSVALTVNGKTAAQYANYAGLNFVVEHEAFDPTASILGPPPLSDYPQQVSWINPTDGDDLGFIVSVQQTNDAPSTTTIAPGCKAADKFALVYSNVFDLKILSGGVYVGQCTQCHGDPKAAANAVMNLSGNGVDPCLQVLTRVNLSDPFKSLLLLKPSWADATAAQSAGAKHPVKFAFLPDYQNNPADPTLNAQKALILQWINAEAKAAGLQ